MTCLGEKNINTTYSPCDFENYGAKYMCFTSIIFKTFLSSNVIDYMALRKIDRFKRKRTEGSELSTSKHTRLEI